MSSFPHSDDIYDRIPNSCDNTSKIRKAIPRFFKKAHFMKTIIVYSITAIFATALFIFWMMHPTMATRSDSPVAMTIFLVGTIICGYMPLFGTVILNYRRGYK